MRAVALLSFLLLAGCAAPAAPPEDLGPPDHVVNVRALFEPALLNVSVGDVVQWVNTDPDRYRHTVTPASKAQWRSEGSGDDEESWLRTNATWTFRFVEPGTYDYYCVPHGGKNADGTVYGQTGRVVVTAAP